ncbi:MAG: hypothetical protein D8M57_12555 [Candidatus Scalindua sp. AMX11]|nr:MAG: hypothetical protein DWQ00_00095 [Candidatus Scalindua sp.]NOG83187.1 hypothetical protein [Planctomycetota bacterium]RZV77552.1 MAG: hypothetical protein EX341_11615 [Candidatus Scalindua sp. SCAELEC01]TDE64568.1 MAG: hypothetical protein D8M57_12555 [Candidatus Scalindua sp. AMX11]GJQ58618.1 MAG: hypothetical protein SCALA701_14190 [Candidatus Scalindua sp.]
MEKRKKTQRPINLSGIRSSSIRKRKNLVNLKQFARVTEQRNFDTFIDSLPKLLAGNYLREVIDAIVKAVHHRDHVVLAIGAHVIKCGLAPLLIDLMERDIITAVAMNSAAAIHDYEISLIGETSEDVAHSLTDGSFGMATETVDAFQRAACRGSSKEGGRDVDETGLGRALGNIIIDDENRHKQFSLLANAASLNIPSTIHTAIGTDTIHMHPSISSAYLGESSHVDFRILCSVVTELEGGVWLNVGSAVIMPEVFLKALTVARNLGRKVDDFTTVNMDMVQHYRPLTNVVRRPGKKGYSLTGHHEIMVPLLRAGVLSKL